MAAPRADETALLEPLVQGKGNFSAAIKEGDLVVLKEATPPLTWKLGRVTAVHPGADDIIRVATVKTDSGTTKRAGYPPPFRTRTTPAWVNDKDLRGQYRDGLRVEQSESQVRSHFTQHLEYGLCPFTRAYSQTSEASIRLSKPRSPITVSERPARFHSVRW
ncbi:hypothetical protein GEV33_000130 [Tenebrio molitor]|uniref:DUF5641 domain-containing protein n=1 Tax=Tenebrio molitor TaxID=7067 RepID=A0A8J6HVC0_TENMO|nr:hypothetical protein GEV33_000130 [Tenebrio molitor]